jgi:hypothetical protein
MTTVFDEAGAHQSAHGHPGDFDAGGFQTAAETVVDKLLTLGDEAHDLSL